MQNDSVVTSNKNDSLFQFVNSIADMEIRKFTLIESAQQSKNKAQQENDQRTQRLQLAKDNLNSRKKAMDDAKSSLDQISTYRKYMKLTRSPSRFWGTFFAFVFIYGFVAGISSPLLSGLLELIIFGTSFEEFKGVFVIPLLIFDFIIYLIILRSRRHKKYNKELNSRKKQYKTTAKNYDQALEQLTSATKDFNESQIIVPQMLQKVKELEESTRVIEKNLEKCYESNIIPPSYRNLICIILINDVFINNKADSIREAILLCDIEIRHAEIVNKLNDINHSLQSLASSMHSIDALLQKMNSNISSICSDISSIRTQHNRITYAAESMQRSAENLDFYIAQRRVGAL